MFRSIFFHFLFFFLITLTACKSRKHISIKFHDEYVVQNDTVFSSSRIGGLSSIDYDPKSDQYYIVCDDARHPRFYKASIEINNNKIEDIRFTAPIKVQNPEEKTLDLEALRLSDNNTLVFTSEGSVKNNSNPAIFTTELNGTFIDAFKLPDNLLATGSNAPRHNAVFEGLTPDIHNKGFWASMELPLQKDGEEPSFLHQGAPARITFFDKKSKTPSFQFTYPLDKLARDPKGKFGVNGITGLVQITTDLFIILERGYVSGYGTQGNTVKLYVADKKNATNTLHQTSLSDAPYSSASKKLLFDFESVRAKLTNNIVDNIEGITIGPTLPNGNPSLILIADNNFNPSDIQINQFILMELIIKK
ncbi:esterase-like activity of phytase family protein [Aquimarina sp. TRL1]|uniref:esterase-like activity of phytase family protein n=1 Tax=Aquimarina sp. (strain TRL1) TaxID=2736252 RepID=UPI00158A8AB4|nr:esterase-like activity of phytase family protein [Aquimarina sp. TRL1]QKX07434.1 esterase-like activity of phytase family protein [Aquimarina sp. TRL1]